MLAKILKNARLDKKIGLTYTANELGCSKQNLSRIEAADNIEERTARKYANIIDCDILVQIIDKSTNEVLVSQIIT